MLLSILGETLAFTGYLPARLNRVCLHRNSSCRSLIVFTQVTHLYILLSHLKGKKLANIRMITKYYGACPRLRLLLHQRSSDTIVYLCCYGTEKLACMFPFLTWRMIMKYIYYIYIFSYLFIFLRCM
jgi:hypothetical protein